MEEAAAQRDAGAALPEYRDEPAGEDFWRQARPRREPLDWPWFLPALLLLLTLNVPWYLPDRWQERLWSGLPIYTWVALLTSVGLSALISWSALRHWSDADDEDVGPASEIEEEG